MKRQSLTNYAVVLGATVVMAALNVAQAYAVGSVTQGVDAAHGDQQPSNLFGNAGVFSTISNVLLFIVGAVAVIMIIIGGLRYVVSGGDASQVQAAKNTILYALIGVIVAILAYAAVNFVVASFVPNAATNGQSVTGTSAR